MTTSEDCAALEALADSLGPLFPLEKGTLRRTADKLRRIESVLADSYSDEDTHGMASALNEIGEILK
jgi:hypothetical protein